MRSRVRSGSFVLAEDVMNSRAVRTTNREAVIQPIDGHTSV